MASSTIRKEVEHYLPWLSDSQQNLVLEMIKNFLNLDDNAKRISKKQYNEEIAAAVERIKYGTFITHEEAL